MLEWQKDFSKWLYTVSPTEEATGKLMNTLQTPQAGMGLKIYRRNLYVGLVDHLIGVFPQTMRCCVGGETGFRNLCFQFIESFPPRTAELSTFGGQLSEMIHEQPLSHLAEWEWLWHSFEVSSIEAVSHLLLEWQVSGDDAGELLASRAQLKGVFEAWKGSVIPVKSADTEEWEQVVIIKKSGKLQAFVVEED